MKATNPPRPQLLPRQMTRLSGPTEASAYHTERPTTPLSLTSDNLNLSRVGRVPLPEGDSGPSSTKDLPTMPCDTHPSKHRVDCLGMITVPPRATLFQPGPSTHISQQKRRSDLAGTTESLNSDVSLKLHRTGIKSEPLQLQWSSCVINVTALGPQRPPTTEQPARYH